MWTFANHAGERPARPLLLHARPPGGRQCALAGGPRRRPPSAYLFALILSLWVTVSPSAQAQANPTVPQGGSATFAKTGTTPPSIFPWDIVLGGSMVASSSSPGGWTVSYSTSAQQFTVGAPSSATVATGYQVRDYYGMGTASATFDVVAGTLQLSSVSLSPTTVIGGNASTGTVTLSQAAPTGGITVTLTSSNTAVATVPASVTVAQGQTTATFSASTVAVATATSVTISAVYNGVTKTAVLTVNPVPALSSISLSPAGVTGGTSSTGTATLTSPAGPGGVFVTLSSSNTNAATAPASVTVAEGQASAFFTVTTTAVATQTAVTISGIYNGVTKTAALTVYPPDLISFSISPTATSQGHTVTGSLGLDGPAPVGGIAVSVTCSTAQAASFPATVTIPPGSSSTTFAIVTSTVNYPITVTFTATFAANSFTASLTLTPGNLHVTDLVPPYTIDLTWDCQASGSFVLKRDGVTIATLANTVTTYSDVFVPSYTNGQIYYYEIFDSADMNPIPVHLSATKVAPYQVAASDNQAVDSRLDLRYSTNVFLDHQFGSTVYRGGLFAGVTSDNSKVGRSYAKFSLMAPPAGLDFRVGNLAAYCTGAQTSGTQSVQVNVGCQAITDTSWLGSSMVWTTPANLTLNPASAVVTKTVTYNPATLPNPAPGWTTWPMYASLQSALANTAQPYSVAWTAANETAAGWAYFAKKEYDPTLAPCALYALEAAIPIQVTITPSIVVGGGTLTVSIIVNGIGIGDSANVAISASNFDGTTITGLPGSFTVTGLSRTFMFSVDTAPGYCEYVPGPPAHYVSHPGSGGGVTLTATCNGVSGSAILVIQPYPAPASCP
jgi:hypothetical protein